MTRNNEHGNCWTSTTPHNPGEVYNLTKNDILILQSAARYMRLPWKPLAARPAVAREIIDLAFQHGIDLGCELYAIQNRQRAN